MLHGNESTDARDSVRLEGAPNFRDLGGLTTLDRRRVRPRLLFRSEGPAHFNTNDVATLRGLGIRTVCDLRSDGERAAHPNQWCDDSALLPINIAIDVRVVGNEGWDFVRADPTAAGGRAAMAYSYRAMGRCVEGAFRQLIGHLLQPGKVPVLIHCTGGKDRTGVVIALLLHALGVKPDQIEADYLLSSQHTGGPRFAAGLRKMFDDLGVVDPPPELLASIIGVEAAYLKVAMEEILRGTGTLDRFFEERIGLDESRRAALEDIFLHAAAMKS
jgi:protein-tyrosine phosphatase